MTTRVIYKYRFDGHTLTAPRGNVVLVAYEGRLNELPTIWIEHELEASTTEYMIRGTGQQFDPIEQHVGSTQCGRYVWHVYRPTHPHPETG